MPLVTIKNDFHNSEITIRAEVGEHFETTEEVERGECSSYTVCISDSQWKRFERELCGIADCYCGRFRGRQEHNSKPLEIHVS